ncbi:MAG: right-handed parallel beta-helix repeat-containing protein [Thermoplasmata archaeon]|nr:right-handed parallel beta-helix repeat-containing protein [Thermoplasmata archaeon]
MGHGLVIAANNIVIDGNNFTIDGVSPGLCEGAGIQRSGIYNPGFDNVTIKNLEIKNFCNGIYLRGDKLTGDYVYENIIENCNVHHNGNDKAGDTSTHGIKLEYTRGCIIKNCSIHHNTGRGNGCESGGNGIFLYGCENNYIFNNLVFDNTKGGIFSKMKSSFNKISYNTVTGNGQGGIILRCKLSMFNIIDHNNIEGNKGPGIYVGGPKNTLSYNFIAANEDGSSYINDASIPNGVRISREADFTNLISNVVTGHEYDIWVKQGLTGVYGSNNSYNTSENYDESWGMKLEKIDRSEDSNAGLPAIAPTPLMATAIVFLAVMIVVGGYMYDSSKQRDKKSFLTFEIFKRQNKK